MGDPLLAPRLRSLPVATVLGWTVPVAVDFRVRLAGLAGLGRDESGPGLLIPSCASVHTFGMRFAIDVFFLDEAGALLAVRRAVPARRVVFRRGASAVLEVPASEGGEIGALAA